MTSIKILGFTRLVRVLWRVPGFKFHGLWVNFHMDIVQSTHLMNKWEKNSISSFSHESPVNQWKIIQTKMELKDYCTWISPKQNERITSPLVFPGIKLCAITFQSQHQWTWIFSISVCLAKQCLTLTIMIITGNQV